MRFHVVTTMNQRGWEETGRRLVDSFLTRWCADAHPLVLYAEGFDPGVAGVEVRQLPNWIDAFKAKCGNVPKFNGRTQAGYDYRLDAVKFAHKVAALTDYGKSIADGVHIWLDADTYTHEDVTSDWLRGLFPEPAYVAWLDRKGSAPETGFVMYRASHHYHQNFMASFENIYTSGALLKMAETNDSFVLQQLVLAKMAAGKISPAASLSGAAVRTSHPLINSRLGECLDHCKGERKKAGISRKSDIVMPRHEPYWRQAT